MNRIYRITQSACLTFLLASNTASAQGMFQNLDFENGSFIPIPGDPFGSVLWAQAMPGWTGYIGANSVDRILHNNLFLSYAGLAIMGPDFPAAGRMHGRYYVVLQESFPVPTQSPALAQTGTIPSDAQSIRFLTDLPYMGIGVSFAGQQLGLSLLGQTSSSTYLWGGSIGSFAGQTGLLRFFGDGYLDDIQFSSQPIPEPGSLALFGAGVLLVGWQRRQKAKP